MNTFLIKNATLVNEGESFPAHVEVRDGVIKEIFTSDPGNVERIPEIDAAGRLLLPGMIDDQVHFREPGLTHKAEIYTESRAAAAGGITSFMEMPNTVPNTLTVDLLEEKYATAAQRSLVNYSFFMGASNDNLEEVLACDPASVCGIKVFMGSSTGNMLVDNETALDRLFEKSHMLIATHCEEEAIVRQNKADFQERYGKELTAVHHPLIRSREACLASSSKAVRLAKKHGTRLHILHISTADELALFDRNARLEDKRITAEACVHHLWFSDQDYSSKGNFIKWNPAVKSPSDRQAIWEGLWDGAIDVVATDHAPHTKEEKSQPYAEAPAGGPLVQHAMVAFLDLANQRNIPIADMVNKMSHAPARCFQLSRRGFIRPGYWADLVLVEPSSWEVTPENILYKCGWSPFEGHSFQHRVTHTWVNGQLVYEEGQIHERSAAQRLTFSR